MATKPSIITPIHLTSDDAYCEGFPPDPNEQPIFLIRVVGNIHIILDHNLQPHEPATKYQKECVTNDPYPIYLSHAYVQINPSDQEIPHHLEILKEDINQPDHIAPAQEILKQWLQTQ